MDSNNRILYVLELSYRFETRYPVQTKEEFLQRRFCSGLENILERLSSNNHDNSVAGLSTDDITVQQRENDLYQISFRYNRDGFLGSMKSDCLVSHDPNLLSRTENSILNEG